MLRRFFPFAVAAVLGMPASAAAVDRAAPIASASVGVRIRVLAAPAVVESAALVRTTLPTADSSEDGAVEGVGTLRTLEVRLGDAPAGVSR